jgi:acetyl-CoA carboxylase biotin carboxyl carrier protein
MPASEGSFMPIVDVPAPMAGTLKELLVASGEAVTKFQELLIIESMKMEIPLECPEQGSVAEILVTAPQRIDEGQVLLRLEVG